ncbi:MAG: hypothetical protein AAF998_08790 [Bacteroidota bacterium]
MESNSQNRADATATVDTDPVATTTMVYDSGANALVVSSTVGDKVYNSGSLLKISINSTDEYEVEDPGAAISSYSFNKQLNHSGLQCFGISQRSGIGVSDFRDFKIKDTWDLSECFIGLQLADSALKIGYNSNTPPCFTEQQVDEAQCIDVE